MNIRSQVTLLIAGIFVILGLAAIMVGKLVLMPSFAQLERSEASTAMRRIDSVLDQTLSQVAVDSRDWGNWADTYRFVQGRDPDFAKTNITGAALRQVEVNALLIVDKEGNVLLSKDIDLTTGGPLGIDMIAQAALPADFPWRANFLYGRPARGLLRTNQGVLMLAAAPILDGNGGGPARGMVLMGRLLTPDVVQGIAAQAQADLTLLPPDPGAVSERIEESDTMTRVFRSFNDLYGRPVMGFRVDVPREVTLRGKTAVKVASTSLFAAAVLVLVILVVVLNRVILDPLALITRHAVAIGESTEPEAPLDLKRDDEMGVLAREFDRMVARVAESRMQLVDQSFQAGFAELARGVLHNLGNAMTPIGVRLASLGERLRQAPAEDAEQAVAELQGSDCEPDRRADLEAFMRLACRELAATVRCAREDVAVMSRQTSAVQTTLAEQMRATRNEHVIEPVRLTELVAQSLEIVPDACRQRLAVEPDETLRRLGVVRVARTVLRLILQNLIINAADAVRDAGKDRGVLRLSAEIVRQDDVQQLHLSCKDDGVGIAPQNLQRVFEKGFSTKSPETNQGIGLHWCANAIAALGGRIWAASEGPGRGASVHLLVPLAAREPATAAGVF